MAFKSSSSRPMRCALHLVFVQINNGYGCHIVVLAKYN